MRILYRPLGRILVGCVAAACLVGCQAKTMEQTVRESPHLGLPATVDQVHSLNILRLRLADGADALQAYLRNDAQWGPITAALVGRVGFDPLRDLDQVVVGRERGRPDAAQPFARYVVIARGRLRDPAVQLDALRQWLAEEFLIAPPPFTVTRRHEVECYSTRAQSQYNENVRIELNLALPAPDLIVAAGSQALLDQTLDVIAGRAPGLGGDEFWKAMLTRPDLSSMGWGVGQLNLTDRVQAWARLVPAAAGLTRARHFFYQIELGAQFRASVGLIGASIEDASAVTDAAKAIAPLLWRALQDRLGTPLPETVRIVSERTVIYNELDTCRLQLPITPEERRALLAEWTRVAYQVPRDGRASTR